MSGLTVTEPNPRTAIANPFLWIALVFLAAQVLKFFFLLPEPEIGGDAALKWQLARDLASGSLEVVRSRDVLDHHYLRWGSWGPAALLIRLFGDGIAIYFLSTAVLSTLAGLVFLWLFHRHFGVTGALLFGTIWYFDPQIYRATFQLLPSGAGLMPLALLILVLDRYCSDRLSKTGLVVLSAVALFWLYGAKETNAFFVPGALAAVWLFASARAAFGLLILGTALYFAEALALSALLDRPLPGGRLLALLLQGGHVDAMSANPALIREQVALWDAGILSRWYTVKPFHIPIYFGAIVCFFYFVARRIRTPPSERSEAVSLAVALIGISFVLLTSFFIISLDPVVLGQPLRPRYLTILIPLAFFSIFAGVRQLRPGRTMLAGLAAVVLAGAGFALAPMIAQGRLSTDLAAEIRRDVLFGGAHSLGHFRAHYASVASQTPAQVCDAFATTPKEAYRRIFTPLALRGPDFRIKPDICPPTGN